MWDAAGEARMNAFVNFFYGTLHTNVPVLVDQQELIYIRSVQTQNVVWKTCQEQWKIETDGERERERERDPWCLRNLMIKNIFYQINIK